MVKFDKEYVFEIHVIETLTCKIQASYEKNILGDNTFISCFGTEEGEQKSNIVGSALMYI